jgi:flagellar biosynthetic protein FlhB
MSDDRSTTLEPTPHRLDQARRAGQVGASPLVPRAGAFAATLAMLALGGAALAGSLAAYLRTSLASAATADPAAAFYTALVVCLKHTTPVLGVAAGGALVVGLAQTRGSLAWPRRTAQRRRGVRLAAIGLVLSACAIWLVWARGRGAPLGVMQAVLASPSAGLGAFGRVALAVLGPLAGCVLAAAVGDLLWMRWRLHRSLRMTRAEWLDERRVTHGDAQVKAWRRRAHAGLLRELLAGTALPASLVCVGGQLAVALAHDAEHEPVPRVLAVASGLERARLLELANEQAVPTVWDAPLCAQLASVSPGQSIPDATYDAVARALLRGGARV